MKDIFKVLIVDDEMLIRQGIISYIDWEKEGYNIIGEASNGEEALHLIDAHLPDIILTDIVMPGMDGIELVKRVKANYPETEIIVLSSFENFDYVKETFQSGVADYILKPKLNAEDLIQTLRRVRQGNRKQNVVNANNFNLRDIGKKILKGYPSIREMEFAREEFHYDHFTLVELFWSVKIRMSLTSDQIITTLQQHVSSLTCHAITIEENSFLLLINVGAQELPTLKAVIKKLANSTDQATSKWILSQPFQVIDELKNIYDTNHLMLKQYHFYLPEQSVLYYDQLPQLTNRATAFDLNHLIYLFKRKQFQEAFDYLNEQINLFANHFDTDVFTFKSWLENIMFNIITLLGNMNYDMEQIEADKYQLFTQINEAFHVGEAISIFDHFLTTVEKKVHASQTASTSNIQRLLDYIEENYSNSLTLRTLGDYFHFNPTYLSSYFSKHHEEGFSEYLNHVRIKNAQKMLIETNMSISSISESVGYSDPSYFTKVFKKVVGVSPRIYRRQHKPRNRGSNHEEI
ncbi:response regulator transcription factor [Gracilibacillus sp. S3-1-1]|uniref:Response regulator transcription factor n=1 Tax=Gracilibacillus pellucidus TaxID=3095368 RepID=A0ACC6M2F8_9BACI|nr:response regulator transcription factor [Gracilibacillus sp. S3-1-1]MDX8045131.1 response regulator transcription factor [Gracilibacillus sp. S3-1-1]